MIMVLPKWVTEEEVKLRTLILKIAERRNINYSLVLDSKNIAECIDGIISSLVRIQEDGKPQFTKEELKDIKELNEAVKKKIKI